MKNYVAPVSSVLSMNLNENIAASTGKTIITYNGAYWLENGKIQNVDGLETDGADKDYVHMLMRWVAVMIQSEVDYEAILAGCEA